MSDLALDPETGDLLIVQGDAVIVRGADATGQDWSLRLGQFKGEWPLDRRVGIDYQGLILTSPPPPKALLHSIFERVTLETAGIKAVQSLEFAFDRSTRELTVTAVATYEDDTTVVLVFKNVLFVDAKSASTAAAIAGANP